MFKIYIYIYYILKQQTLKIIAHFQNSTMAIEIISQYLTATFYNNTLGNYLYALLIIALSIIVGKIVYYLSTGIMRQLTKKTKTDFDDIFVDIIEEPLVLLIVIAGIYYGTSLLTLSTRIAGFVGNTLKILIILDIAYFIIKFIDTLIVNYVTPLTSKTKTDLDDALIPIVRKLIKAIIIVVTTILILSNFGYDVSSILAGLGIGGLAFALAAKDLLANLFGGAAILGDKPFRIGDRIRVSGNDGKVEEIGMRSTKIRTLDGTLLTIPNSVVADSVVENVSKENARKIKTSIGLTYDTSDKKTEKAIQILKDIIKKNKDTDDKSIVILDEFGDFALSLLVIYWIKDLNNILDVKNKINLEIKKQFTKAKIDMAFPTQTIELKK